LKKILKKILLSIDQGFTKSLVCWLWPQYRKINVGYMPYYQVLQFYFISQKVLRINGKVPWPVHYTSRVIDWQKISKGTFTEPGDNLGQYINASGGLIMGDNVLLGPNVVIASTNHYRFDFLKKSSKQGIEIGDNVWIGANATILAGSIIGSNVVIGAGCVISGEIPDNCTVKMRSNNYEIIIVDKPYGAE